MQEAVQEEQVEEELQEDLLRGSILRAPLEPVVLVRDRDRVYGDCLPKSPQPATRAWRSPTRVRQALRPNTNMKNVVFGALGRDMYISGQGMWGGCGRVGEGRRGGGAVQAARLAGDGPPKAPRDNI